MSYTVLYDTSLWRPIPAGFPDAEFSSASAWADDLVDTFEADLGPLSTDGQAALREFAFSAIADRQPDITESVMFCPRTLPVVGIVNVMILEAGDEVVDLRSIAAGDPRAQLAPTIEEFDTTHLGPGYRGAVAIDSSADSVAAGAFTYAFQHEGMVVIIAATADSIPDATLMLPFVDGLVRGISVEAQ